MPLRADDAERQAKNRKVVIDAFETTFQETWRGWVDMKPDPENTQKVASVVATPNQNDSFDNTDHVTKVIFSQDNDMNINNSSVFKGDEQPKEVGDLETNVLKRAFASEPLSMIPAFLLVLVHPSQSEHAHDVNLKQMKGDERDERINSLYAQTTALESLSSRYVRNNHILEGNNRRLSAEIDRLKALLNQQQKAPKLVGIGMRITDEKPHRVTEVVAGGAAYQSGEIAVGDYILEVGRMVVSQHSIETIRKNVLGQAGSYLDLVLERRDENDASKIFSVTIKRSEIVATDTDLFPKASPASAVADSLRAQLRAKEFEIEGLQQKLQVMAAKNRELTSSLDGERHHHKLGQNSSSGLAKSMQVMEAMNSMQGKRMLTSDGEFAAEIARLLENNRMLEEKKCTLEGNNSMLEKRLQSSEREFASEVAKLNAEIDRFKALFLSATDFAAEIARLQENNRMLQGNNRMLEKRLQTSEREPAPAVLLPESASEDARLNAEMRPRPLPVFNHQHKAPKLVGIGMRITDEKPHRVTEIVAGGAAYQSGEIAVGDYILEVGRMVVSQHSIETIRKNVLGQAGSYLDLVLERRDENNKSKIFTVTIKR